MSGRRRRLLALALAGSAALGACAGRRGHSAADADAVAGAPRAASIPLRVENHNYNDVVIWVERAGNRTRLGTVGGSGAATLAIPAHLWANPEGIRLAAETVGQRSARDDGTAAIGDRRVVTERLVLAAGQRVTWTIESGLQRSHVGVQ